MKNLVKKSLPCSFYDIQGVQSWLDEMALQGLFLHHLSDTSDRAYFLRGEPRPVRYRLDPLGTKQNNAERKELYAQMGWEFVDTASKLFDIFSCGDPSVPELHSDPQTLGYALGRLVRRQRRTSLLTLLALISLLAALAYAARWNLVSGFLLWERPLLPPYYLFLTLYMAFGVVYEVIRYRKIWNICRELELGLTPKAGRRHWRPTYLTMYFAFFFLFQGLCYLGMHYTTVDAFDYQAVALSHPWVEAAEQALEYPAYPEFPPRRSGEVYLNAITPSTAPVQERLNLVDLTPQEGRRTTVTVRYVQAASPALARLIYRSERHQEERELKIGTRRMYNLRYIEDLRPFTAWERPGADILEAARFRRSEMDSFSFILLRGSEVLMVEYTGPLSEDACLELFLNALNQTEEVPK